MSRAKVSKMKNDLVDAETFARNVNSEDPNEVALLEIYRRYSYALRKANAFDFDDLIAETVHLFRAFPDVAALYQRRFRHVLVDEYQDTNHAQYALIRELTRPIKPEHVPEDTRMRVDANGGIPAASLTVVGDSDQSIYAFRGADIRNIVEFERDFPDATVILLEQNYRSTQNILDAANAVIANNFDRTAKNLFTTVGSGERIVGFTGYSAYDEAQFVADEVQALREAGAAFKDMAVFFRTNSQTRALEDILIRSAIPYRIAGGTKFYERAEIKDVMAYLIQVANPADDLALRRIMNTPKRGIGPATEAALQAHADRVGTPLRESLRDAGQLGLGPKVTAAILGLGAMLDEVELIVPHGQAVRGAVSTADQVGLYRRAAGDARPAGRGAGRERRGAAVVHEGVRAPQSRGDAARLPDRGLVGRGGGRVGRRERHAHPDDPAHREGPRVRHGVLDRASRRICCRTGSRRMSPAGVAEERRLFYVGITRAKRGCTSRSR